MNLTREVRDLGEDVEKLREENRDLDRRLVKVETIIELARERSRQLPRER